jgi:hypothetical protein
MSSGVFVLQKDGTLVEMSQQEYDSEDMLQTLLATYPNLLAGDQIDELNPRKWILISREFSVPDDETSEGRWSLDHLFLDQDGIPTLVEVKRSSDTRIRREVIGQMIEYAANAVSYWAIDKIRLQFETRCEEQRLDPEQVLTERFQIELAYEDYWEKVSTNLDTGKIRMLFIADEIPFELKQIVEFLNEQMNPAEVLAVEIKQYVGHGQKTLIPRVYGQSSKIQQKKVRQKKRQWDEPSFLNALLEREGEEAVETAKAIIAWAKEKQLDIWWGKGSQSGSCFPLFNHEDTRYWLFALWTYGGIEIQFQIMKNRPVYNDIEMRKKLLEQLNSIIGVFIPEDGIERRPTIPFSALQPETSLNRFLEIWEEFMHYIRTKKEAYSSIARGAMC